MAQLKEKRWWQSKHGTDRTDIVEALKGLREMVENINKAPSVILTPFDTYRHRDPKEVQVVRVGEWELGYGVKPVGNPMDGFFVRSVFAKLHGGRLDEINKRERKQIVNALADGVLDPGQYAMVEFINDHTFCIRQPFAVMFQHERNMNIVTPTKELLLAAFDPSKVKDN